MRAVGYARVSTLGQAIDGVSLGAQRARIRAYCEASGYDLVEVLSDDGLSGGKMSNRPGLARALATICDGGGALVVYSLSRLSRSTRDTLAIADRLAAAGADLVSLSEKIDTTSASGKMLFRLMGVLAEFEREQIAERTLAAMAHKRSRGERIGQLPIGFRLAPDGRTLELAPDELAVVEEAKQLRADGLSIRAIAKELTARGHRPKNGGDCWGRSTVASILKRRSIAPDG